MSGEAKGYCGCCGNTLRRADDLWCFRCVQSPKHLGRVGLLHERTYFATRGEDCPFQVGRVVTEKPNYGPSQSWPAPTEETPQP